MKGTGSGASAVSPDSFDGVVTLGITLVDILAFDDITTDTGAALAAEWTFLAFSALWAVALAFRLFRRRDPARSAAALGLLVLALYGKRAIGPGVVPAVEAHYLAEASAMIGFVVLGIVLVVRGARGRPGVDGRTPAGVERAAR